MFERFGFLIAVHAQLGLAVALSGQRKFAAALECAKTGQAGFQKFAADRTWETEFVKQLTTYLENRQDEG